MEDEQQLASIVLLLRLSTTAQTRNENNDTKSSATQSAADIDNNSTQLQRALEQNDCNLLVFIGRLIHTYNNTASSDNNNSLHDMKSSISYAFLRLAVHVLFLYYTEKAIKINNYSSNNERVLECEQYLLRKLLPEKLRVRTLLGMEEVDVEIAFIMRSILQLNRSRQQDISRGDSFWVDFIEALVNRYIRKEGMASLSTQQISISTDANDNDDDDGNVDDDEKMMLQIINSILDGEVRSKSKGDTTSNNGETKPNDTNACDWNLQFSNMLVDSLQSFIQSHRSSCDRESFLLKWNSVVRLIQFSQQSDAMSVQVYVLILQYFRLCMQLAKNRKPSFSDCFIAQEDVLDVKVAASIRSFVFYGMTVLGNTIESASTNQQEPSNLESTADVINQLPTKGLRAEVYLLTMDLWRMFGHDWLFYDSGKSLSVTTKNGLWWFRAATNENQLGVTWPLCTLVQLAAGDLRLNLGRWVTIMEDCNASSQDNESICVEIESCAAVVLETVQLMTRLLDDEGAFASGVWIPDALLHIRKSLEDALNSAVQYLNSFSCNQDEIRNDMLKQTNEIGKICCVLVGTIASEVEVEDLLVSPSIDERNMQLTKDAAETSCFASALSVGMMLCNSIGEVNAKTATQLEMSEPLCCLLPCIMSVVACSYTNETVRTAISALSDPLVYVMSRFLYRIGERWRSALNLDRQNHIDETVTILSITELCLLIIEELVTSSTATRAQYKDFKRPLHAWKDALLAADGVVEDHVDKTLEQVCNCLELLDTYQR